ncbi:MAG: hypothetical protein ACTHN5_04345 [Phycisphaerae bacterium]
MHQIPGIAGDEVSWAHLIPAEQWSVYERTVQLSQERGIAFAVGGGIAFSHYASRWRNTKDLDIYVMPDDRYAMIQVVRDAGLVDYFDVHDYDRGWIFRSHDTHGIIVDIIWQMANYRAQVDRGWLARGDVVNVHGTTLRLLPPEELIWSKLYVVQRDRCDWGDLLNILNCRGDRLDWAHLLMRVGEDRRVLAALLELFAWTCPDKAKAFPTSLWKTLGIAGPSAEPGGEATSPAAAAAHVRLLDSRDWFGPNQPCPAEPAA